MGTIEAARARVEPGALAAAAGDEAAFAELTERYRGELHVHCYRLLGSFAESEDLVQETFLRAWRRRETFGGRSTFRGWLYAIATNACLDALERRPRSATVHGGARPLAEIPWLQPYRTSCSRASRRTRTARTRRSSARRRSRSRSSPRSSFFPRGSVSL